MMKPLTPLLAAVLLTLFAPGAQAQVEYWMDPEPLPQRMTAEEETRREEIGLHFTPTPPPAGPVRNIAEFERSEAALVRYPLGIPINLVAQMSEHVEVITLVSGSFQENQARSAYQSAGVNMENARFLHAPTNSIWTRDYGPFYIADENHQVSVVDFIYNRPRPGDDAVPLALASFLDIPHFGMDVVHTGGNYMGDGWGTAASTDLIWEENGFNQQLVLRRMYDYLNITEYHVTIDPQDTYLKHIDTWAKFLDVDKILIARVPSHHPHYNDHEAVAEYFATQPSAWGTPYQVFRIDTPNGQPYTNSIILNERVYVPLVTSSPGSGWNDAALAAYAEAMPGYEIVGVPFSGWLSTDALHCRVKEVADRNMLYIRHLPVAGTLPVDEAVTLSADFIPYSGADLIPEALALHYRINATDFASIPLEHQEGHTWSATIPLMPGDVHVSYYFSGADASGVEETFPLVGEAGARRFSIEHETVEREYVAGWQMVGLPLHYTHTDFRQVFEQGEEGMLLAPTDGGYGQAATLELKRGYWLRKEEAASVTFAGTPSPDSVIELEEGWNLISAGSEAMPAGAIDDPAGILVPHSLYGFEGGYEASEELAPGTGYWIQATEAGSVTIGGVSVRSPFVAGRPDLDYDTFHRATFSDGAVSQTLYLAADYGDYGAASFRLPPAPPEGLLDARFEDHSWLTTGSEMLVMLQQSYDPTTLTFTSADVIEYVYRVRFYVGETLIEEMEIESGMVADVPPAATAAGLTVLGPAVDVDPVVSPLALTLEPNYPNPFSTLTEIRYSLPAASDVMLEVFDLTGRRVAILVEGGQAVGAHSISFEAGHLSSGVYLYRLQAGDAVRTRYMVVVR